MHKSTKQQLNADMERLTAQRERYALAAKAAQHDRARERHTRTLARLEEEILGLQEAIDALDGPLKVSTGEFRPVLPAMGALVEPTASPRAPRRRNVTLGSVVRPPPAAAVPPPVPPPVPDPDPVPVPVPTRATPTPPPDYAPILSPTAKQDADAFDAVLLRRRITVQAAKVMTSAFAIGFIVAALAVWSGSDDPRAKPRDAPAVAKSAR